MGGTPAQLPRHAGKNIGQIGGGMRKPTGVVDIAMIQSLVRKGVVDDLVAGYGHLVVDECHHLSAVSFEAVARRAKPKFVLGLSSLLEMKYQRFLLTVLDCPHDHLPVRGAAV
jgi:superfamily II DNA or RNA helicase